MAEWLFEDGTVTKPISRIADAIAGGVNKRHAARSKGIGHILADLAIKIHVEHGSVKDLLFNQGNCLFVLGCGGNGFTSEVSQHVFNHHEDEYFVLDNKNAAFRQ